MAGDLVLQRVHLLFQLGQKLDRLRYQAESAWVDDGEDGEGGEHDDDWKDHSWVQAIQKTRSDIRNTINDLIRSCGNKTQEERLKDLREAITTNCDRFVEQWIDDDERREDARLIERISESRLADRTKLLKRSPLVVAAWEMAWVCYGLFEGLPDQERVCFYLGARLNRETYPLIVGWPRCRPGFWRAYHEVHMPRLLQFYTERLSEYFPGLDRAKLERQLEDSDGAGTIIANLQQGIDDAFRNAGQAASPVPVDREQEVGDGPVRMRPVDDEPRHHPREGLSSQQFLAKAVSLEAEFLQTEDLKLLSAMNQLRAISEDTRHTQDVIATTSDPLQTGENIKHRMAALRKRGYVDAKGGRGGGNWLTPKGLDVVNDNSHSG